MTIFDLLFKNAKYRPNEPAISWQEGQKSFRLSNSELWIELKKIISFLRDVGIEACDKVGIFAHTTR
jgi:long-subunit acyl-CoA synthetase (AMP-forming)